MRIYSMTATFGKLENQTLTLQPGLNILEAPNEWGKSTWCAFIVAMLYGIDTKARTTQTALADKEHYAPWSGAPMEGRMDICWNGRDITIERRTRGRLIFGDFRAYETHTGLDVPELTASNCGMELLGVERSVFTRAGFLKLADLPVTQDDALRRRLNNLVTTGDESGAGERLAQSLKELKNKCRYNRSGLLPLAEAERDKLEEQLRSLQDLNAQAQRLQERQQELEGWSNKLQNHKLALQYEQAKEESRHIREAISRRDALLEQVTQREKECSQLPAPEEAERIRTNLQRLHNESMSLSMEQQMLPSAPQEPTYQPCFAGMDGQAAVTQAQADAALAAAQKKAANSRKALSAVAWIAFAIALLLDVAAFFLPDFMMVLAIGSAIPLMAAIVLLMISRSKAKKSQAILSRLCEKYGSTQPDDWCATAEQYAQTKVEYEQALLQHRQMLEEFNQRKEALVNQLQQLTRGEPIADCLEKWERIAAQWKALGDARRDLQGLENQIEALQSVAQKVPAPTQPDELTQTLSETDTLLNNADFEMKQNQLRLGQFQGQADALGQESALRTQLKQVRSRIERLEETYKALELAQNALSTATSELQRRFAPRIAKRAQELFGKFTDGRYQKVMLAEDLSVHVSAEQETTMRAAQWRSDGTVDQLYLALRLAVAEELTPAAPLVLDDAMVRFDDDRLATALHILQEMAEDKQVILFTCQGREKKLQGEKA